MQMFHRGGGHGKRQVLCWALLVAAMRLPPLIVQDSVWQVEALQFPDVLAHLGKWDVAHD